ncbi:hypothetical protein EPO33_02040 [Patescibacteria group bacterium]|nr:MAG: hypothetical protein EPO33_02040 [Patescibacteria group bacterium]
MYKGIIIEESLREPSVLNDVDILETNIEQVTDSHQTPWLKQWTLHTVEIAEDKAEKVVQKLSTSLISDPSSWYADFKNPTTHVIIFPGRIFRINRSKPEEYDLVKAYGMSLGIPEHQVDFSPEIE